MTSLNGERLSRLTSEPEGRQPLRTRSASVQSVPAREEIEEDLSIRQILDGDGSHLVAPAPQLTAAELQSLYRAMVRVRVLDTKGMHLQRQGRLSFYVPSFGEEAAHIGSAFALGHADWIFPCYREQGAALVRGYPLRSLVCQLLGKQGDYLKGRQMPHHFGTPAIRFAAASSPVGTQIIHAVGAAYASWLRGEDSVTLVYFGDGATSTGDFHVGMNFAAVWQTPTVFFCKNNGYAISTPVARQTRSATLAQKASAYGMRGVSVDGNDVLAVYQVTREAIEHARGSLGWQRSSASPAPRSGQSPTLIEAITYRMGPHTSADDPTCYRQPEECEVWEARDPIPRFRRYLEGAGLWSDGQEKETWEDLDVEVSAAFRWAETLPEPELETLVEDVYAEVPAHLREQFHEAAALREAAVPR
jgi:pyruvate dehydrogenase E1 component alpha subunit